MPSKRLTKLVVERTRPPESGRLEIRDTAQPGFGVRITDKGVRSYFVVYRIKGDETRRQRRWTIGLTSAWELDEAREEARRIIALAQRGVDPVEDAAEKRATEQRAKLNTFAALRDDYIEKWQKAKKRRSWRQVELSLKGYCAAWDDKPVGSITRRDVQSLINEIGQHHAPAANRLLSHLKHLFKWAVVADIIETSPAIYVVKAGNEPPRDRVLTPDEIKVIWKAAETVGWPYAPIIRLLFLTGQRVREPARMRWKDLDEGRTQWTLPREIAKTNQRNIIPLSPMAQEIVCELPKVGRSGLVFPSSKKTPPSGWSKAKAALDKASGVTDWQLRDIRRTVASGMAGEKVERFVIELILNHRIAGSAKSAVEGVYNTFGYIQEKRDALESWADRLALILADDADRVVMLPAKA